MGLAEHWRLNEQFLRMRGEVCPHCKTVIFPPRDLCPNQDCKATTIIPKPNPKDISPAHRYDVKGNGTPIITIVYDASSNYAASSAKIAPND